MSHFSSPGRRSTAHARNSRRSGVSALCLLFAAGLTLWWAGRHAAAASRQREAEAAAAARGSASAQPVSTHGLRRRGTGAPGVPARETVAARFAKFTARHHELVHALARRLKLEVPPKVDRYFEVLAAGRKAEADRLFLELWDAARGGKDPVLAALFRPIQEAHGVSDAIDKWSPQPLLDYGNLVLDSLAPGMAYLGRSDSGCFIPLFMNETGDAPQHPMATPEMLSSPNYMDYLACLYGDQFRVLTTDEMDAVRQAYLADYQARAAHDQASPNEPRQLLPGEASGMVDGQPDFSNAVVKAALNDRLLQSLIEANAGLSFGMEQTLPAGANFGESIPFGPIMEVATGVSNPTTFDSANQVVTFWQATTSQLLGDPDTMDSATARQAYATMMATQASLLASQNFPGPAEQTLQLALQLVPGDPALVLNYAQLLTQQNRNADALQAVGNALKLTPDNPTLQAVYQHLQSMVGQKRSRRAQTIHT